ATCAERSARARAEAPPGPSTTTQAASAPARAPTGASWARPPSTRETLHRRGRLDLAHCRARAVRPRKRRVRRGGRLHRPGHRREHRTGAAGTRLDVEEHVLAGGERRLAQRLDERVEEPEP